MMYHVKFKGFEVDPEVKTVLSVKLLYNKVSINSIHYTSLTQCRFVECSGRSDNIVVEIIATHHTIIVTYVLII